MEKIGELKGQNGTMILYRDYLEIVRASMRGLLLRDGHSGSRKYFLRDVTAIEYKPPTFIANGYLKVLIPGSEETNANVGILGSSASSMADQNTLVLRAFTKAKGREADRFHEMVMAEMSRVKSGAAATPPPLGRADELAKLAELRGAGVLSEEEFQAEKKRLLTS